MDFRPEFTCRAVTHLSEFVTHENILHRDVGRASLVAAKLMLNNNLSDFAVARAYYTMFYIAQAFLLSKELSFSSHKAVISNFGREFVKTELVPIEFYRWLIDGQLKRHKADYEMSPNISNEDVQELTDNAEKVLEFARQYFKIENN
jgi:uncharacterized protein (UPF0332 family)